MSNLENRIGIMFVCHGNICRSTMAEFVMKDIVERNGYARFFNIQSSATSNEEIGNDTHHGTKSVLDAHAIPYQPRHAVRLRRSDASRYDFFIGMDSENLAGIRRLLGSGNPERVYRLMEFAGRDDDIADPWYSGDFETTYQDVVEGCNGLFQYFLDNFKAVR